MPKKLKIAILNGGASFALKVIKANITTEILIM
jgi:hypothetical protein